MSPIAKGTTTEYRGLIPSPHHSSAHDELLTHSIEEPEDFAEFVKKLTKATWFCEVAEA